MGITEKNGAEYEILEARKNGKYIIVFDLTDIERIIEKANAEAVIQDLFYSLWIK
jgi:hypothetical protein